MKCPHCLTSFHEDWKQVHLLDETGSLGAAGRWWVQSLVCPECKCGVFQLRLASPAGLPEHKRFIVYPKATGRTPVPKEVQGEYRADYTEACAVLVDSPKASAALSRRLLQHIIREKAGIKGKTLDAEITALIDSGKLPSHLSEAIDAVRNIGNFAAHPIKSTNTGEIVDVEPGEAEWLLDTIEGMFDFYFVQPAILKAKREALDQKLAAAGKPPMK